MIFFVAVLLAGLTSLINLYEAPIATVQEKLHLGRVRACAVIAVIGAVISVVIRELYPTGWMCCRFIFVRLEQGLPGLCSFGYAEKIMWKSRSIKEGKSHLRNGLYRFANTCIFQSAF